MPKNNSKSYYYAKLLELKTNIILILCSKGLIYRGKMKEVGRKSIVMSANGKFYFPLVE